MRSVPCRFSGRKSAYKGKYSKMSFYQSISSYYDRIFPASPTTVQFLHNRVKPQGRILDIACGTGNHTLELARRNHLVTGIDLDEAMLDHAVRKRGDCTAEFMPGNMLRLAEHFPAGGCFDLIYCIGNSIVHLDNEQQVAQTLRDCRRLLSTGGCLVIQTVNFDKVLGNQEFTLPTLHSEDKTIQFTRKYEYDSLSSTVFFHTVLAAKEGRETRKISNRIPLLVIGSDRLCELVSEAGFTSPSLHGSFRGEPYTIGSPAAILTAQK